MITMILTKNIKEFCAERKAILKTTIENNFPDFVKKPTLAVFQIGDVEASTRYIRNKKKDCEEVGINFEWYYYPEEITTKELIQEIKDMNDYVDGLIIQMPLPDHIDLTAIKLAIDPKKDVDGFHPMSRFEPCTPFGIVKYLIDECDYNFTGKNVTIFGHRDRDVTPVPDDVELLTRVALLENTVLAAQMRREEDEFIPCRSADHQCTFDCIKFAEGALQGTWKPD